MTEVPQSPTVSSTPPNAGEEPTLFDDLIEHLQAELEHKRELRITYDKNSDDAMEELEQQINDLTLRKNAAAQVGRDPSPPTPPSAQSPAVASQQAPTPAYQQASSPTSPANGSTTNQPEPDGHTSSGTLLDRAKALWHVVMTDKKH